MVKPKAIEDSKIASMINYDFSTQQPDMEVPIFEPEKGFEPKF